MTTSSKSRFHLDVEAQARIATALRDCGCGPVIEEEVRIRTGNDAPIITAVVLRLDDEFSLTASVNGGIVNVSVGDGTIQIQRFEWRRGRLSAAIGWMIGYAMGYRQ